MCCLFHKEISRVHTSVICNIDLQRMRYEKTLCSSKEYHMDGIGSSEKNIYLSGAHVTVNSM